MPWPHGGTMLSIFVEPNDSQCQGGTCAQEGHWGHFTHSTYVFQAPLSTLYFSLSEMERHYLILLWLLFMEEGLARVEVGRPLGTFPVTETPFPTVAHLKNTCSTFQPRFKDLLSSRSFTKPLPSLLQN